PTMSKSRRVSLPVFIRDTGDRLRETQTRIGKSPCPVGERAYMEDNPTRQPAFFRKFYPRFTGGYPFATSDPQRGLNPSALSGRADGCASPLARRHRRTRAVVRARGRSLIGARRAGIRRAG